MNCSVRSPIWFVPSFNEGTGIERTPWGIGSQSQPFQHVLCSCYIVTSSEGSRVSRLEVTIMLLDTIFAPFVKERPICVMAQAVLERLLDAPRIDDLCARTAKRQ